MSPDNGGPHFVYTTMFIEAQVVWHLELQEIRITRPWGGCVFASVPPHNLGRKGAPAASRSVLSDAHLAVIATF